MSYMTSEQYGLTKEQWKRETREIVLVLWDRAVGTQDYDKQLWRRLQNLVEMAGTSLPPQL